jgi:uncharacterized membrane protein YjgN (DUF898 family)
MAGLAASGAASGIAMTTDYPRVLSAGFFGAEGPIPVPAARFVGRAGEFWRIVLHGAPLLLITLGIYRFWLNTDIRRFLWSSSQIDGEPFEYVGTARELLLGFLFAIAVLVPLYVALFAASLAPDLGLFAQLSSVVAFLLLWVLGQYAVYRARRYRLTRTVYRGVRFTQTGSAWRYAVCATFWSVLIVVTLGLAYPFAQASLERFKMRHTFFGDLPGRFDGSGLRLFLRGFLMWLLVFGPPIGALAVTIARTDWSRLAEVGEVPDADDDGAPEFIQLLLTAFPSIKTIAIVFGVALVWSMLAALFLYPVFRAMMLRWWASGVRFGEVTATSRLRTAAVYGTYARFAGLVIALSLTLAIAFGMLAGLVSVSLDIADTEQGQIAAATIGIAAYVLLMLGYSALHQGVIQLSLWRLSVDSLHLAGTAALAQVVARGAPSSPFGEGLADALDVGGL